MKRNTSVCILCGAYAYQSCEWEFDDPPCEMQDTFFHEPEYDPDGAPDEFVDYAVEDRIRRRQIDEEQI